MKKIFFYAAAVAVMASCANKQSETTDTQVAEDTVVVEEVVEQQAVFVDTTGYTTTASGLKYKVVKEGTGAMPKAEDSVEVHYTGKLLDGTVFDSSVERGETISFPLKGVIKGWTEGLQLMKEGAKYEFIIPPYLAYGERGTPGGPIGPNATLYFEVELFKVK
ncbi:MAG: FKBP-type peptidyl-prolyl cis-trans isomerase [Bacteroidales bacterium]|nr:FKBP-type peptidyl-prolyl cis-trans isomerase [Bacteroidales bacterium]